MRIQKAITILSLVGLVYAVGCAKVRFSSSADVDQCQKFGDSPCVSGGGRDRFEYLIDVPGGQLDILFVDDNSGSMSFEQTHMAERFQSFVTSLDSKSLDYRIGIITTDVSHSGNPARAINQNGLLQDGKLVPFLSGISFLTPSVSDKSNLFYQTIKRAETKTCEDYITANPNSTQGSDGYLNSCPSPDERGIFAMNLFMDSNPDGFMRDNAHLAVVILSDEDVRSSLYHQIGSYPLDEYDLPQTFLEKVRTKFPGKTVSVHTIIVKPGTLKSGFTAEDVMGQISSAFRYGGTNDSSKKPDSFFTGADSTCKTAQGNQIAGVSGSYGFLYSLLSKATGGIEGDICASDYKSQLESIGDNLGQRANEINLACLDPSDLIVRLNSKDGVELAYSINGSILKITQTVDVGNKIYLKYSCPTL